MQGEHKVWTTPGLLNSYWTYRKTESHITHQLKEDYYWRENFVNFPLRQSGCQVQNFKLDGISSDIVYSRGVLQLSRQTVLNLILIRVSKLKTDNCCHQFDARRDRFFSERSKSGFFTIHLGHLGVGIVQFQYIDFLITLYIILHYIKVENYPKQNPDCKKQRQRMI